MNMLDWYEWVYFILCTLFCIMSFIEKEYFLGLTYINIMIIALINIIRFNKKKKEVNKMKRSEVKRRQFSDNGQSEFDHKYACLANNHNGWRKMKKKNRKMFKKKFRNETKNEIKNEIE